jgi:Fe2+ transport system protein B
MPEQNDQLSAFMKKQISEKSTKKTLATQKPSLISSQTQKKDNKTEPDSEMSEEEQLEEAKKLSSSKASQRNQTEMVKRLIIENVTKYVVIILVMMILAFSIIKSGPAIVQFFDGLISKIIFGAISKH